MNTIKFSIPEQLGTEMRVDDNIFQLHIKNERLTDNFLDELITAKENSNKNVFFVFDNTNCDDSTPVTIMFNDGQMVITSGKQKYEYAINFDMFFQSFVSHVKEYALYYVAPCNYMAFFYNPINVFLEKINKYKPQEAILLKKIEKY